MNRFLLLAALAIPVLGPAAARGQALNLPAASPAASVPQTIDLTNVTVVYHRPAVAGRAIWGKLVPYGEPWRAGANENTTIALSSDVKIGGKPLKAGTYGPAHAPRRQELDRDVQHDVGRVGQLLL